MVNKDYIKKELEQFLKDIKFWRGIALRICGAIGFFILATYGNIYLFPDTRFDNMIKNIQPPAGAVKINSTGYRTGRSYYYKFPGMNDKEVRAYYKKELVSKGWNYSGVDFSGHDSFTTNKYHLTLEKSKTPTEKKRNDYDWIISLFDKK